MTAVAGVAAAVRQVPEGAGQMQRWPAGCNGEEQEPTMPLALARRLASQPDHPGSLKVAPEPQLKETDLDRILKLIPTEVIALYAALLPVVPDVPSRFFPLIMYLAGLALVPIILILDGRATGERARWPQYVVRTLAFAVWAMAVAWPFSPWLSPGQGRWLIALAVPLVPFLGGLLLREPRGQPT